MDGFVSDTAIRGIFDSGTSNIVGPRNRVEAIYALISPNITAFDDLGTYGMPCEELDQLTTTISVSIGGLNYTIPSQELNIGQLGGGVCQTLINATPPGGNSFIIGGSLLKYYYSAWDIGNAQFGLAKTTLSPKECANP